ncbi:penicillin acylase family protein [Phreatobacter sp. HK31-P]
MTQTDTLTIPGLSAPGSIGIDANGIPHIRAENEADLFFLQGFHAARERLFQIDVFRKRGLGLLAADFGPGYIEQDRASRLFLYRGDMEAEYAGYGPEAKATFTAFVNGINAFIAMTEKDASLLPFEFGLLDTKPARWAPEDVSRIRTHSLSRNALSEILRCQVHGKADHRTDLLRRWLEPPVTPKVPEGLDPASIPLRVLDLVKLATANATFSKERLEATLEDAPKWRSTTDLLEVVLDAQYTGSNNWAVHGSRTDTGMPILGSDPHRVHGMPSLRTVFHLTCPTLDIVGAGEPSVPGVMIGHNGTIAWGLTIFYIDQEDLYFYETHPDDRDLYRYGDTWERVRTVEEKVKVKGCDDQILVLKFTRHGPVVHEDAEAGRLYAIRAAYFEPGTAPYLVAHKLMRAKNLAEFRAAAVTWGTPSCNLVYADKAGDIAWMPAGINPVRPNWDGLLPVPGDGRYEWAGWRDRALAPVIHNPERGFVFSANEMNVPEGWDHEAYPFGFEWVDYSRANRIEEVLLSASPHTLATSRALQTDVVSIPARRLGKLLAGLSAPDPDTAAALAMLGAWDHALTSTSAAGALFEVWWAKHLKKALWNAVVAPELHALMVPGDVDGTLAALEAPDDRFGADPAATRNALLLSSLGAAYAEMKALLGPDPQGWAWGKLHHGYFQHPLSFLLPEATAKAWSIGPVPHAGSAVTPMHTGYRGTDFRTMMGSSFRLVVDLADLDRSVTINTPGQSGNPNSPHYRDLFAKWAAGDYVPLPYSEAAVEATLERKLVCKPG